MLEDTALQGLNSPVGSDRRPVKPPVVCHKPRGLRPSPEGGSHNPSGFWCTTCESDFCGDRGSTLDVKFQMALQNSLWSLEHDVSPVVGHLQNSLRSDENPWTFLWSKQP